MYRTCFENFQSGLNPFDEIAFDCTSWHTYGAVYYLEVFFAGINISLFEGVGCIAFIGGDKYASLKQRINMKRIPIFVKFNT